jgi:hypothetical protein
MRSSIENTFVVWRNHKIIELGELIAWRHLLEENEQKRVSNAALGSWLWPDSFDDKKIHKAIQHLNRAIADLRALNAQAVFEVDGGLTRSG